MQATDGVNGVWQDRMQAARDAHRELLARTWPDPARRTRGTTDASAEAAARIGLRKIDRQFQRVLEDELAGVEQMAEDCFDDLETVGEPIPDQARKRCADRIAKQREPSKSKLDSGIDAEYGQAIALGEKYTDAQDLIADHISDLSRRGMDATSAIVNLVEEIAQLVDDPIGRILTVGEMRDSYLAELKAVVAQIRICASSSP